VRRTPSARLLATVREAMDRELRFPASLFFALRGAFRHRSLHLFRAHNERGPEFTVAHVPTALDATHVVADLRQVLEYVNQKPGCTRQDLLATLAGGDEARSAHLATQLNTLVEKAHIIEYYNGVLCPPMEHPAFRYLPGERGGQKPEARGQRPEGRGQRSEVGGQKPDEKQTEGCAQEPPAAEPAQQPEPTPATPPAEAPAADPAQPA